MLDATVLSDEHAVAHDASGAIRSMGFTGAFVGLWAWDLTGGGHPVDVDDASYIPRPSPSLTVTGASVS